MALGGENIAVAGTDGGADVFRLTGLLRDDDLIRHHRLSRENRFDGSEHIMNKRNPQAGPIARGWAKQGTRGLGRRALPLAYSLRATAVSRLMLRSMMRPRCRSRIPSLRHCCS
jgi:hypothetical protein